MKFTTRELVLMGIFGALWGLVEISLGAVLHALKVPMGGAVLAAIGLAVVLVGRMYVPRRGSTLFIGVIVLLLKLFSIGSVVVGPMVGILAEALLAEIILSAFPRPRRLAFMLAGAVGVLWTLVQPFFTGWLIFGRDMFIIWLDLIDEGARLLRLDSSAALWIVLGLLLIRVVLGALAGWLAWSAGARLRQRVAAPALAPTKP
jgi:hypothetical protein